MSELSVFQLSSTTIFLITVSLTIITIILKSYFKRNRLKSRHSKTTKMETQKNSSRQERKYTDLEEGLDLLSLKEPLLSSDLYKVSFAFYKASPHLMILPKDKTQFGTDLSQLTTAQIDELFRVSRDISDAFDLTEDLDMTLSIHRDKWISRTNCFHAHLAFGDDGKGRYLEIFEEMRSYEKMSQFWPSKAHKRFVTREWDIPKGTKPSPENIDYLHARNVTGYPNKNWKSGDLRELYATRNIHKHVLVAFKKVKYHSCLPQIGLAWNTRLDTGDPQYLRNYLMKLEGLVQSIRQTVSGYEGSHICVNLSGRGFPGFDHTDGPVIGYVQLAAPTFYALCPEDLRSDWLGRYELTDGRIFT